MKNENMPKGSLGYVKKVDDIGQIHMLWENGSTLALNTKLDEFRKVNTKELKLEEKLKAIKLKEILDNKIIEKV